MNSVAALYRIVSGKSEHYLALGDSARFFPSLGHAAPKIS
jgi:hypothetical protein